MTSLDLDAVVVGAGCVGLATAAAFARRGESVVVLETQSLIGSGVSSRNSEVIHAGFYYPEGSWKARLCVEGRRALYAYCAARGVEAWKCGKLVIAAGPEETPALEALKAKAERNGVEGLVMLTGAQAQAMEPNLSCAAAFLSPESGLLDSHGYMLALQGEIEDAGGAIALSTPFEAASPLPGGGWRVRAGGVEPTSVTCRQLVIAAGLSAQDCAARIEGFPHERIPKLHFGKGIYFSLTGPAPFGRLIYPLPVPGGLGVHYKKDRSGRGVFGPDLEWVEAESYHVPMDKRAAFAAAARKILPGLRDEDLAPDYAGVRPKLHAKGEPQPDFNIDGPGEHGLEGLVCLFGIESPGLTSSMLLGKVAADLARGR